jgi:hypothetical protein
MTLMARGWRERRSAVLARQAAHATKFASPNPSVAFCHNALGADACFAARSRPRMKPLFSQIRRPMPIHHPGASQHHSTEHSMRRQKMRTLRLTVVALSCAALMAACSGGGSSDGGSQGQLQVINFKYPGGATLLSGDVTLSATATSGLPVSFTSSTPSTCTVSGDQLTLVSAGECLVVAHQTGGAGADGVKWAAADDTSQLFNVLKHAQAPVVPVGIVLRASSEDFPLSATTDGGIAASYTSTSPEVCKVSGTTLTVLGEGACLLGVTAAADDNYEEMSGTAIIPVGPLPPFVVQSQGKTQTVALGKTDADGSALSYSSTTPAVCAVVGSELRLNAKGSCNVTMSKAGGSSESLMVSVDPRFFATGFNQALNRTAEFGEINFSAGVPLASWCGGATPSWCNLTLTPFSSTFGFDIKPASNSEWTGSTDGWWAYYNYDIGAPRQQLKDAAGNISGYDWLPFDVKTEESLFVTLSTNATLFAGGGDLFVRIRTNHYQKKADGSDCYVTASVHLHPTSAGPTGYMLPLKDFAVTNKCDIAELPQTEGWMFDWGVSDESKAAALAEIRANGIRALEFSPGSINLSRPTPKADGSLPDPKDPDYTLSTDITVWGPITVQ